MARNVQTSIGTDTVMAIVATITDSTPARWPEFKRDLQGPLTESSDTVDRHSLHGFYLLHGILTEPFVREKNGPLLLKATQVAESQASQEVNQSTEFDDHSISIELHAFYLVDQKRAIRSTKLAQSRHKGRTQIRPNRANVSSLQFA